jgi:hypothetical protein
MVAVYLGEIDWSDVAVELYADAEKDGTSVALVMVKGDELPGASNGNIYPLRLESGRLAADFTVRIFAGVFRGPTARRAAADRLAEVSWDNRSDQSPARLMNEVKSAIAFLRRTISDWVISSGGRPSRLQLILSIPSSYRLSSCWALPLSSLSQ